MDRFVPASLALLAVLPATCARAQGGGVPYNRGLDPSSVSYETSSSGGHQVSADLRLSTDAAEERELDCTLTMWVNGVQVGEPATVQIHAGAAGRPVNCDQWCNDVCRNGWCRNIGNLFCLCISLGHADHNDSHARVVMPSPPLFPGDLVTLQLHALPSGLPEIDPGDDRAELLITGAPCSADLDGDGVTTSQDFFTFLTAFFSSAPLADINHDGAITSQDFFDFLAAFFAGC